MTQVDDWRERDFYKKNPDLAESRERSEKMLRHERYAVYFMVTSATIMLIAGAIHKWYYPFLPFARWFGLE